MLADKLYYDINELANHFGLEASTLRYWEKEFPMLKPSKRSGDRIYTPEDVALLTEIVDLVKKKKYTLKGARVFLETQHARQIKINRSLRQLEEIKQYLTQMREYLG
jgi:DNA-binding transcriptional MerR regulator